MEGIQGMTILDQLADHAKERVYYAKKALSAERMRNSAYVLPKGNGEFEKALKDPGISLICECKKASPSKGVISEDFPYLAIAKDYEAAGANAISILTEPKWFMGSLSYLEEIANEVSIPTLRKDFTIDEYMIYEAKIAGASAVLLIAAILEERAIRSYLQICRELGLSALVECHDENEVDIAISAGASIIGVNNRNLKDFSVDVGLTEKLRKSIPKDAVMVSESGIKSTDDIKMLCEIGVDAVLIGETLMRAENRQELLRRFKAAGDMASSKRESK